ncbi:MAG TPA: Fic family protein [Anaerolineaceae bacterium]|jgi:Fic family protein|nr:Fic family protein [Anaerolineaceae bacterium]
MVATRAGKLRSNLGGDAEYRSFVPTQLPPIPAIDVDGDMLKLLVEGSKELTILESISRFIPNINVFVAMYVRKEALMSSQIEGTQATLDDILDPAIEENVNRDVAEVLNYIKATEYAINRMKDLPLSNRLIKETHAVLMQGIRGQEWAPGEFRNSQNWIGGQGSTLKTARFIPPNPKDMLTAIADLENYMHTEDDMDVLIRAALIHYQFETIHPFLDGNGRIGRLLILLYLMDQTVLTTPALYVSYFLKKNRVEYYDRLSEVRRNGNYEQWVKFFLLAILESARDAVDVTKKLSDLHDRNMSLINNLGRASISTKKVFEYLEANPIMEINRTAKALNLAYNTVLFAVQRLTALGILKETSGQSRNQVFSYESYLNLLRDGT